MTAVNALAAGEGFVACSASYGVTDLVGLVATTHDSRPTTPIGDRSAAGRRTALRWSGHRCAGPPP